MANGVHMIRMIMNPEPWINRVIMLPIRNSWLSRMYPSMPRLIDDIVPIVKPVIISLLRPHLALHFPRMQPRIMLGAENEAKKIPLYVRDN